MILLPKIKCYIKKHTIRLNGEWLLMDEPYLMSDFFYLLSDVSYRYSPDGNIFGMLKNFVEFQPVRSRFAIGTGIIYCQRQRLAEPIN